MGTYTAFIGNLRPGLAGTYDNVEFYYPIYADALLLDENDHPVIPGDVQNQPDWGFQVLASIDSIAAVDTVSVLRTKVMGNFWPQYPQLDENTDTLNIVWL